MAYPTEDIRPAKSAALVNRPVNRHLGDSAVAREKSAIDSVVSDLVITLDTAHNLLSMLQDRIEPGLAQLLSDGTDTPANQPSRGSSQLCYRLEDVLQSIYSLQNRIVSTTDRVEL